MIIHLHKNTLRKICVPVFAGLQCLFYCTAHCQNTRLIVKSGTTVNVAAGDVVLRNTDILANGTFDASNGKLVFTGSATSAIGGSTPLTVKLFTLNKSGDLLVTSGKPGYAMKADLAKVKPGQVIGKALQKFNGTDGKIKVLVNVR